MFCRSLKARLTISVALVLLALAIAAYHVFLLQVGFFDSRIFLLFAAVSLILLVASVASVLRLENIAARFIIVLSVLLGAYWVLGLASLAWKK